MSTGEFALGLGLLTLSLGAAVVFALVVVRRQLPGLTGIPRLLAGALLTGAGYLAIQFVPGVLGVIGRPSLLVCSLILLAAVWFVPTRQAGAEEPAPEFPPGPSSGTLSWALAAVAVAAYAVYLAAHGADHGAVATRHVDMTTFHLPNVVRWIQNGTFWQLDEFVPYRSLGTYPNTSDLLLLGAILPFDSDFLVRFVNYPLLAITGVATYAVGRELRAPASTAALLAVAVLATPAITLFALEGLADALMLATFSCGLLFLLRYRRTDSLPDLLLAALSLGICLGTKWYSLAAVGAVIIAWVGASLVERVPLGLLARRVGVVLGIVVLAGGFWMLRNVVEVGNPLYPQSLSLGGLTILDAPRDLNRELIGFALSDYLDAPSVWREHVWPGYKSVMGWLSVALWLGLAAGAVLAFRARAWNALMVTASAAIIGVVFVFTPYTAFGPEGQPVVGWVTSRYVMPALVIGAAVSAWAISLAPGRLRVVLEGGALVLFFEVLRRNPDVSARAYAVALLAVAALVAAALLLRRLWSSPDLRTPAVVAGVVGVALAAAVGTYALQDQFIDGRYAEADAASRWVIANAPKDQRIGVVGEGFVVHPLFGPRLENEVEYVGPIEDGMLVPYMKRESLRAALARRRYELVLVQDQPIVAKGLAARQEKWLKELGYQLAASGQQDAVNGDPVHLYRAP